MADCNLLDNVNIFMTWEQIFLTLFGYLDNIPADFTCQIMWDIAGCM